ncbi:MAG: sugar transferase [Clostridiales bacterium]|nr:sugar transferase [Clostridiales bacterium]
MQKNDRPMDIADVLARRKPQLIAKRAMDIVLSACALAVLWPLLLLIALAIWIDDPGPVFYRQVRVGRNGKTFRIFKFRSMVMDADKKGLAITVGRDSRITRVGAVLRKTKLDELAQLLNVLFGQMSFVGPRPEVPKYVELYTPYQRQVLLVRPGITDYASIAYRNENDLLAGAPNPETMYIEQIMPDKIELNMKYLREISPLADIRLILKTIVAVIKG